MFEAVSVSGRVMLMAYSKAWLSPPSSCYLLWPGPALSPREIINLSDLGGKFKGRVQSRPKENCKCLQTYLSTVRERTGINYFD